eukprot:CAMPEP_0115349550 /NCGR_PEP_ID=MMETSP0270-20121206/95985_1 /TAXON_ID=71861 /ORGANISM="Scrippsiella trochoidea, Strain CCMP3099" /LENGTH=204 /DNA_ID=CAMNT_0002771569 /DNA_START=56 /DNA_END=667 /DNA_ORIENTATION=-
MLDSMHQLTLDPGAKQYTSVVVACSISHAWEAVPRLLEDMQHRSFHQDRICRNAVMVAQARTTQWQSVFSDFEDMLQSKRSKPKPERDTWNTILNTCIKSGEWQRAMELWFDMQRSQVTPSWSTYTALLRVAEANECWGWSRELLDTLDKLGAPRTVQMYLAALNACKRGSRWDLALQFLREMRSEALSPAPKTYARIAESCEL